MNSWTAYKLKQSQLNAALYIVNRKKDTEDPQVIEKYGMVKLDATLNKLKPNKCQDLFWISVPQAQEPSFKSFCLNSVWGFLC